MRIIILLLCYLQNLAFANVALDQLNQQLALKEPAQTKLAPQSPLLKDLSENYYFAFIYRSSCPHCRQFAPILQDFAQTFHIGIDAYSIDGGTLDGIKGKPLSPDLFQTFYLSGGYKPMVPALFLVNRDTLQTYAVLFGETSPYQLARRINELMQHIQGRFNDQEI